MRQDHFSEKRCFLWESNAPGSAKRQHARPCEGRAAVQLRAADH
ncbi:hypothetical protein L665_02905 [Ralstonia solanacearum SD54]|nr:hypothetical protein F504_4337 [Ralstonia pseudosolanacearum FQY_4]ESS47750.1 hypothetical protein L665_02905 [Ralstonia solanacearum SD54]